MTEILIMAAIIGGILGVLTFFRPAPEPVYEREPMEPGLDRKDEAADEVLSPGYLTIEATLPEEYEAHEPELQEAAEDELAEMDRDVIVNWMEEAYANVGDEIRDSEMTPEEVVLYVLPDILKARLVDRFREEEWADDIEVTLTPNR